MNVYIALAIQQLIGSGTHLVAKTATQTIDPVNLTMVRNCISMAAMGIMFIVKEKRIRIEREDWKLMFWLCVFAVPTNQFLYLYGIKFTLATNGALLYATTPAIVLLLSTVILKENLTRMKVIGVCVAFMGVSIVMFERGIDFRSDYFYGNVVVFFAVLAWARYALYGKKMIRKYGAFHISALSMIGGAILFLPFGVTWSAVHGIRSFTPAEWGSILYLSLGTSVISYVLWFYALGRLDATKVTVFSNAQPIITTILAVIFLHQPISTGFVVGGLTAIAGVVLTQRR